MAFAYMPGITSAQKDFGGCDDITLDESNAADYLRSMIEGFIARSCLDAWCGLCKCRNFTYEDGASIFETIDEAYPTLKRMEEAQMRTREAARASRN
jgi:hypothetical protein